mgnify:CR=1 FL=1
MTKEQVLNGEAFTLPNTYDDTSSYKLDVELSKSKVPSKNNKLRGSLTKQHRMTNTLELIFEDYLYNIEKVGTKKVHLYTFMDFSLSVYTDEIKVRQGVGQGDGMVIA